ncbi:hypothetical protein Trydic_g18769 [Trypoxylus dichotomus]
MVPLDLEKAFDKVRYERLQLKMKDCDFPARLLKTVRTYPQNRRFHTVVNRADSPARRTDSGVPKGYALGPVLFTIYIRDIRKPQDHRVFNAIYTDDTAVVATSRHSKIAAELAQTHLAKIEFFCTWGLKINPRKTQVIAFTQTQYQLEQKIIVARTEIDRSGKIEYLGILSDPTQSFIPEQSYCINYMFSP